MRKVVTKLLPTTVLQKTISLREEVCLHCAAVMVNRKTKKLVRLAGQAVGSSMSQQQLAAVCGEAERFCSGAAKRLNVDAETLVRTARDLHLLRELAKAKPAVPTAVVPIVIASRM